MLIADSEFFKKGNTIVCPAINQNNIVIGDSIAEGAAIARGWCYDGSQKYRNKVGVPAYYLEAETGIFWMNCGLSGDTTAQVIARWSQHCSSFNPNFVLVHVGINDVNQGVLSEAEIETNLASIITLCASYKTIIMSLPYQAGAKLSLIQNINAYLLANVTGVNYLYLSSYYNYVQTHTGTDSYIDAIHPSAKGNSEIAVLIKQAMQIKGWL